MDIAVVVNLRARRGSLVEEKLPDQLLENERRLRLCDPAAVGKHRGIAARVERIRFDPKTYQAVVTLKIDNTYQFTTDTIASILTSGLLGEVYVGLDAGGDTTMLPDGGKIAKTQSAMVFEKLIGQFLFDKAASAGADKAAVGGGNDKAASSGASDKAAVSGK